MGSARTEAVGVRQLHASPVGSWPKNSSGYPRYIAGNMEIYNMIDGSLSYPEGSVKGLQAEEGVPAEGRRRRERVFMEPKDFLPFAISLDDAIFASYVCYCRV